MIRLCIDFYDKKTQLGVSDATVLVPDDIVFDAVQKDKFASSDPVENKNINYINCRPFDVTDEMKTYVIKNYPEIEEKFQKYLYDFIGRHGLGPEYD